MNWQWPYTNNEQVFQMGLVSYAPNARVFGTSAASNFSVWDVAWNNAGGGTTKMTSITDGTANTLAVIEKPMVVGQGTMSYKDWAVNGSTGSQWPGTIQMWATTDTPPEGMPFFGCNCNDPTQGWDDTYGQWWRGNCRFSNTGTNFEFFQPPRTRLIPSQQQGFNIYPYHSAGNQALLCDGSVRNINLAISVPAWSAAVTPAGGETVQLD